MGDPGSHSGRDGTAPGVSGSGASSVVVAAFVGDTAGAANTFVTQGASVAAGAARGLDEQAYLLDFHSQLQTSVVHCCALRS